MKSSDLRVIQPQFRFTKKHVSSLLIYIILLYIIIIIIFLYIHWRCTPNIRSYSQISRLIRLAGLTVGDPVLRTRKPLSVELGPGKLS